MNTVVESAVTISTLKNEIHDWQKDIVSPFFLLRLFRIDNDGDLRNGHRAFDSCDWKFIEIRGRIRFGMGLMRIPIEENLEVWELLGEPT